MMRVRGEGHGGGDEEKTTPRHLPPKNLPYRDQ
jgi:hypothetical protein